MGFRFPQSGSFFAGTPLIPRRFGLRFWPDGLGISLACVGGVVELFGRFLHVAPHDHFTLASNLSQQVRVEFAKPSDRTNERFIANFQEDRSSERAKRYWKIQEGWKCSGYAGGCYYDQRLRSISIPFASPSDRKLFVRIGSSRMQNCFIQNVAFSCLLHQFWHGGISLGRGRVCPSRAISSPARP